MKIKIAAGNSKLGPSIPNVSMVPVRDCGNCSACRQSCYALKAWRQYKQTRTAWKHNGDAFRESPYDAVASIHSQLLAKRKPPRFFRVHVAGDFLNQEHVNAWRWLADLWPGIKFLAFTKMHELDFSSMPSNFVVYFSQWPGMPDKAPAGALRAWMQDGTETRVPDGALECPGNCSTCGACFNLKQDVFFHKH